MVPTSSVVEFIRVRDVLDRYQLPGPHASVVLPVPPPGAAGGDLRARWHAIRNNLQHDGATDAMRAHLDGLVEIVPPHGETVLLTADEESAAWCVLREPATHSTRHVGEVPWLLPALAEVTSRVELVGAVVDRVGGDLFVLRHDGPEEAGTVSGEDEFVHKSAQGGWSQPRYQRHAEVVWDRNATSVASALADLAHRQHADTVMLTGDERAVGLVRQHLNGTAGVVAHAVAAGGRHEPGSPARLNRSGLEVARSRHEREVAGELTKLREELGQQDLGIDGIVMTLEAIAENRVATLYVRPADATFPLYDVAAKDALERGARVVVSHDVVCRDGIGALLRFPYH